MKPLLEQALAKRCGASLRAVNAIESSKYNPAMIRTFPPVPGAED